jgi:tetraacyldisaccharide 4'-kinase
MFPARDQLGGTRSGRERLFAGQGIGPGPGRGLAARLFGLALRARRAAFSRGLLATHRVEGITVLSVGSLRAGGAGKTPLSLYLARKLADRGLFPALVLRGYGGSLERCGGLVSQGNGPLVSAEEAGDEAYQAALRLEGVPVRVGADRVRSVQEVRDRGAQVAVLDDGFQHWALARDLDLLLVCPADLDPGTGLLPAGPLREPCTAAGRADLLLGLARDWPAPTGRVPVLCSAVARCLVTPAGQQLELSQVAGQRVHLLSGIERPERFGESARALGCRIVGQSAFPDHHRFKAGELEQVVHRALAEKAELLLTTEKDLSRLLSLAPALPLLALRLDLEVVAGAEVLEQALQVIPGRDRRQ